MRLATWNVNSLKVRLPRVEEWLADVQPDVVCMQETKLADDAFPALTFGALGYECAHYGQGQWNGVAILSKVGLEDVATNFADGGEPDPDARIISARCGGIDVTSVYVPNGRSLDNPHYEYKLRWLAQLQRHVAARATPDQPVIVTGDFNIAPTDADVYDPSKFVDATHTSPRRARAARRPVRLGPRRPVPRPARRGQDLQLVGLPRRRLPPGSRAAHRPRARIGAGRRTVGVDRDRPQRAQGPVAVGPRARDRRPRRCRLIP